MTNTVLSDGLSFPQISRDGTRIVYTGLNQTSRVCDIFTVRSDGSGETRLTSNNGSIILDERFPRWSPDGSRIVLRTFFIADQSYHIRVINADGSGLVQLTDNEDFDLDPQWSPNGSKRNYLLDARLDGVIVLRTCHSLTGCPIGSWRLKSLLNLLGQLQRTSLCLLSSLSQLFMLPQHFGREA